jgi:hypothetical protein
LSGGIEMKKYEMGIEYFKLNGTTDTKEKLHNFFLELGFTFLGEVKEEYGFSRTDQFTDNNGLDFEVIWFVNLAHIRFGNWKNSLFEISFDSIIGSYLPYCDHETLSFLYNGKTTATIAVPK